ncbi:hypothetical protein P8452_11485 [Trifolium repens]|nr:hypothetical protein P8452_11485 [Trifolium repens]
MAPKKRLPSPSLEDDHPPSTQKQPEDEVDSSDEEEDSSSSEEEDFQIQPVSKNPPPSTPISNPKPASESESESGSDSGSDSGSGSDSETDSEPEPTPPPKPLASKPMKAQPKPQTQAQSTPVPAKSGTKRPVENGNDSNRSKKKTTAAAVSDDESETEEDVKLTGEDSKKSTQRIFGEEDELSILKGLADFISKTGKDPLKDGPAFHSFVKKSLRAEANSEQLKRKVRTLKKKFEASDSFTKPHDKKAFELFKKVWGNNGANEAEENGKVNKGVKKEATNGGSVKKETVKVESEVDKSLSWNEMCRFTDSLGLSAFNRDAMRTGYELLPESKKVELAERWRKIQVAEMEVLMERSRLVKDQSNLVLQAVNKSNK